MDVCRRQFGAWMLGGLASQAFALPPRPKLTVLVIIVQFRPEYLDILGQQSTQGGQQFTLGGFRRLLERGAYFPDCRHLASTFSATGIATLATGAWPAQHGIIADSWYDRAAKKPVNASEENLMATTLAAQLAAEPRARVSVIGLDPAQAGLFAGTPDVQVYAMDEHCRFTVRGLAPDWLSAFNGQHAVEMLRGAKWMALGAKPDAPALRLLTYDPDHAGQFLALYKSSPFAQAAQFELLGEMIARERLGQGNTADFVCMLVDSPALLGYETGARSPLMQQLVLQLDRRIETLLAQLGRAAGENGFNFVLAGAHGAAPEPLPETRARMAVNGETLARSLASATKIEKYVYPFLYLDNAAETARLAVARAALGNAAVAGYYTAGGECSTRDEWERRFRNSFHAKHSGDVMLSYRPEYVEDYGQSRGISYGSLYDYDVRVPLCFYGPQFRAGVFEAPVESIDVAPTLARVLGVGAPSSSSGRVLGEALAT